MSIDPTLIILLIAIGLALVFYSLLREEKRETTT